MRTVGALLLIAAAQVPEEAALADARARMVVEQLEARDITDRRVLAAMAAVPRHRFVPEPVRAQAYQDGPLPIGAGQTISQPYIVAFMAQALGLKGTERVLEVGSGSGYAAAVLARLCAQVDGIELEDALCDASRKVLAELRVANVRIRCGDGFHGWPGRAPYDAILLSCAAEEAPAPLLDQLKVGGRLLLPMGRAGRDQVLVRITREKGGLRTEHLQPVRFVPLRRK